MLKENLPGIVLRNVGKKLTLYFKSTTGALINELVNDSYDFYQTLIETALPLRQMMAKTLNNLDDDTMNNIEQVNSIPTYLITLVCTLSDKLGALIVCSYHVTYAFQSKSTLYVCLNVKELFARNRRDICSLSDCNGTRIHNHLVRKRTLNHLANLTK